MCTPWLLTTLFDRLRNKAEVISHLKTKMEIRQMSFCKCEVKRFLCLPACTVQNNFSASGNEL